MTTSNLTRAERERIEAEVRQRIDLACDLAIAQRQLDNLWQSLADINNPGYTDAWVRVLLTDLLTRRPYPHR